MVMIECDDDEIGEESCENIQVSYSKQKILEAKQIDEKIEMEYDWIRSIDHLIPTQELSSFDIEATKSNAHALTEMEKTLFLLNKWRGRSVIEFSEYSDCLSPETTEYEEDNVEKKQIQYTSVELIKEVQEYRQLVEDNETIKSLQKLVINSRTNNYVPLYDNTLRDGDGVVMEMRETSKLKMEDESKHHNQWEGVESNRIRLPDEHVLHNEYLESQLQAIEGKVRLDNQNLVYELENQIINSDTDYTMESLEWQLRQYSSDLEQLLRK